MATNTIAKISKRAKAIRKTGESWQSAIKRASKEVKGTTTAKRKTTRRKTAKKKVGTTYRQTGSSNKKKDQQRRALPPGKRKNSAGTGYYYERRKNRSDMPGKLEGVGKMIGAIKKHYEEKLAGALLKRDKATTRKQHLAAQKQVTLYRKKVKSI